MSEDLVPVGPNSPYADAQLQAWQEPHGTPSPARSPLERPVAAIKRYKWLLVAVVIVATVGGVIAANMLTPQYEVQARILIANGNQMEDARLGPIRSGSLLDSDDWTQLLRSSFVADPVVRRLSLSLSPKK